MEEGKTIKDGTHCSSDVDACLDATNVDSIVIAILRETTTIAKTITLDSIGKTVIVRVEGDSRAASDGRKFLKILSNVRGNNTNIRQVRLKIQDSSLRDVSKSMGNK